MQIWHHSDRPLCQSVSGVILEGRVGGGQFSVKVEGYSLSWNIAFFMLLGKTIWPFRRSWSTENLDKFSRQSDFIARRSSELKPEHNILSSSYRCSQIDIKTCQELQFIEIFKTPRGVFFKWSTSSNVVFDAWQTVAIDLKIMLAWR